jgi:hypothetical protein
MPSPGLSFALAADFHAFFDETDDSRFGLVGSEAIMV